MKKNNYMSFIFKSISGLFQKNMLLRDIKGIMYYIDSIILFFISKPKYNDKGKKKVLIIYNLALGDGVIWRCAAVNLRKIYPKEKYEITLICQKGIDKLYKHDDIYDEIVPIDYNKATVNLTERINNFKIIRKVYYDIVLDPVGISEWTTNILYVKAAIANNKIGLRDINIDLHCSTKKINQIYNKILEIKSKDLSLLEYYSYFINNLSENVMPFKVGFEKLYTVHSDVKLPKKFFIIFPGASMKLKRWPIDRYVTLAEKIYNKTHLKLVLVGTDSDKEALDEFKSLLKIPYIDLVGKTTINDYIDILKRSALIVTNDTSAYHIAVVEEVPVAIITGGYTYYRYAKYSFKRENEFKKPCVIVHQMECFDCGNRCKYLKKNDTNWPCLEKITVDYAWKKIEKLIDDNKIGV